VADKLTPILQRAIDTLAEYGEMRGSDLGWELWGENHDARGGGSQLQNKFCRAAGAVLARLKRMGFAYERPAETCTLWYLSPAGQAKAAERNKSSEEH